MYNATIVEYNEQKSCLDDIFPETYFFLPFGDLATLLWPSQKVVSITEMQNIVMGFRSSMRWYNTGDRRTWNESVSCSAWWLKWQRARFYITVTLQTEIHKFVQPKHVLQNLLTGLLDRKSERKTIIHKYLCQAGVWDWHSKRKSIEGSLLTKSKGNKVKKKAYRNIHISYWIFTTMWTRATRRKYSRSGFFSGLGIKMLWP